MKSLLTLTLSLAILYVVSFGHVYNGINKGIVVDVPAGYSVGFEITGDIGFFTCESDC